MTAFWLGFIAGAGSCASVIAIAAIAMGGMALQKMSMYAPDDAPPPKEARRD